jgi:hypothetical protein
LFFFVIQKGTPQYKRLKISKKMQFQFFLIEDRYNNVDQEAYFDNVVAACRRAAARLGLEQGTDWDGYLWDLATFKTAYPTVNLKTTPSVCLKTSIDERVVFYVGKRDASVLESAFYDIFKSKMQPNGKDSTDDKDQKGDGTSDGAGGSGWFPFGTRECGLMDAIMDGLGLTKGLKQLAYGGLALWTGSRALQSGNTTGQAVQGGAAAYFLYLALTDTDSSCTTPKK